MKRSRSEHSDPRPNWPAIRRRTYEILEEARPSDRPSFLVDRFLICLIGVNIAAVVFESEPPIHAAFADWFAALDYFSLIVFTLEYALRIWIAAEHAPYRLKRNDRAWLHYVTSWAGIVDLLAVLPFWIGLIIQIDLRLALLFRVFRFLKFARYSPAMRSLLDALYAERRALFGCLIILVGTAIVAAAVMHAVEGSAQPDKFGTIADSLWWAIVTLGTVGYGDVVPITGPGRVVAAFTIFGGLIMIALPVGIIATAFAQSIHRRDFVITFGMVARVPLFADLTASEVADVMGLLSAQTVEPGATIVRRGETADSMYFIAAGEVEIILANQTTRLGVGHFFGEIAALRRARRSATIVAATRVNLLVLKSTDMHALMERDKRLAERIRRVAEERVGQQPVTRGGDIVEEELDGGSS